MKLTILPDHKTVEAAEGETLVDAIRRAGIVMNTSCGGRGTCGRCKVEIVEGEVNAWQTKAKNLAENEVVSCKSTVKGDVVINIPNDGRRLGSHKVLINEVALENPYTYRPLFKKVPVTLSAPSLDSNTDDLTRVMVELKRITGIENITGDMTVMKKLPHAVRTGGWSVTVGLSFPGDGAEILDIEPGIVKEPYYGLAIDIGTTTVKMNLVDLITGETIASGGEYNRQQQYGDDVINRIIYSAESPEGQETLRRAVVDTINDLIDRMLTEKGIRPEQVYSCVVAGNTTMTHLFLGVYANYLRLEPYIPAVNNPFPVRGADVGLKMNPRGYVVNLPAVASYVGGDITSGVLATQLARSDKLTLFIDIGTNGEMVLGNRDWQISCAASAGPCFEGGGIKYGMRAMAGAIDKIEISPDFNVFVNTIDSAKPVGICGSGLIDTISTMLKSNVINRTGHYNTGLMIPRLREGEEGWEFVLVWGRESAHGSDIVIREADIQNILRAKGAIFAAVRSLLNHMGMTVDNLDEVLIAGGFGNSLNIRDAVTIGMLPDVPREKYRYVGNTSLKGAQMALTSQEAIRDVGEIARGMTYLELSVGVGFMDEFVSALFLPHTDLTLFKSVENFLKEKAEK